MKIKLFVNILLKLIHCLSYDVYNKSINMDFLSKVEVMKKYRQSMINSEIKTFSFL